MPSETRLASMDSAVARRILVGGGDMDTSKTLWETQLAAAEGATDSDIPTESLGKKCRIGELHVAFVADKEGVKEHVQWWRFEMKEKIDVQSQKGPGAPLALDGIGPVLSA